MRFWTAVYRTTSGRYPVTIRKRLDKVFSHSYSYDTFNAKHSMRYGKMIQTFACKYTQALFRQGDSRRFGAISRAAGRKLLMLDAAMTIQDLCNPPANHLEELRGARQGQYSIRINDQYRVCFRWLGGQAYDVEIVDYH